MARRFPHPKSRASSTRRLKLAALQLIALGAFLAVWPYVLPKMIWSEMAKGFLPVGGIAIVSGIVLWMLASARRRGAAASDSHDVDDARTKRSRKLRSPSAREPHTFERTANVMVATAGSADPHRAPPVRPKAWACEVFEQIEWRRFEAVVEALFAQAGFATKSQSHGADGGVDVWLYAKGKPDTPVSIVQCKHWSGKAVGVDKIRELRGVMASHNLTRGQFASTAGFSREATAFAQANSVNLLGADELLSLIQRRTPEQRMALLAVALEGEYWRPTCVKCGTKMVEKSAHDGGKRFWACPAYPKCRNTMAMRHAQSSEGSGSA